MKSYLCWTTTDCICSFKLVFFFFLTPFQFSVSFRHFMGVMGGNNKDHQQQAKKLWHTLKITLGCYAFRPHQPAEGIQGLWQKLKSTKTVMNDSYCKCVTDHVYADILMPKCVCKYLSIFQVSNELIFNCLN